MPEQQKWTTKLVRYNFNIIYRTDHQNQVVDFLYRPQNNSVNKKPLVLLEPIPTPRQTLPHSVIDHPNLSTSSHFPHPSMPLI